MSITTNAELQIAMSSWLGHTLYTTQYPDFITLFEAAAARKLKVRPMETTATLTPSSGSVALPADYLGWRRVTLLWNGGNVELVYVHPSEMQALFGVALTTPPTHFTIEGSAIKTRSSDTTQIEILYYAKNTALASALNWLFQNNPDVYLFGALCEAENFGVNDERMMMWKARRDEIFEEIRLDKFRERGRLEMRVMGPTP